MIDTLPLPDFCRALLDEDPKRSARDLQAAWNEVHGEVLPRTHFKRVRDVWASDRKAGGGQAAPDPDEALHDMPTAEALHMRLLEAARSGDAKACVSYVTAIKALESTGSGGPAATGEDWSHLTRAEAECLAGLVVKLHGASLDETGLRWVAWIAKAPPVAEAVHPSRIPLSSPAGSGKVE